MRTPPLLADFTHTRVCKPFCEKYLTLPRDERHYENMEKREAKQDSREKKYQDSIAKLADGMSDLAEIKELLYKKLE